MYFEVNLVGTPYSELWKTDGTSVGTGSVSETQFSGISSDYMVKVGDTVFFTASHRDSGQELWKTDPAGTALVKDIAPGEYEPGRPHSGRPFGLIRFAGKLFFQADDGVHGRELWTSDGTEEGTQLFLEINPGEGNGICGWNPFGFIFNGLLFFAADDGLTGCELWTSDGTVAGTWMVAELVPGPDGLNPGRYAQAGDTLFFVADDPDHGRELWTSDGTAAGTGMVKEIRPGTRWPHIYNMTDVGGTLFFSATDGISGYELWKSDGTEAGTGMVKEINPGSGLNINLEVTFAPTVPGPAEATLFVDRLVYPIPFTGVGVEEVQPPDEQIAEVLEFIEDSVALGTLSGDGPGQSASGRLNALANMIEAAGHLFAGGGQLDDACRQLRDAYERCDGEAASELAAMILAVIADQGCAG